SFAAGRSLRPGQQWRELQHWRDPGAQHHLGQAQGALPLVDRASDSRWAVARMATAQLFLWIPPLASSRSEPMNNRRRSLRSARPQVFLALALLLCLAVQALAAPARAPVRAKASRRTHASVRAHAAVRAHVERHPGLELTFKPCASARG